VSNRRSESLAHEQHPPTFLFFSGGFDSTFRLCQLGLVCDKTVQPVYILDDKLDNGSRGGYRRNSKAHELDAITQIVGTMTATFPCSRERLLEVIFLEDVAIDNDLLQCSRHLFKLNRFSRPINQYTAMAQVTKNLNQSIELAIENSPQSIMRSLVIEYLNPETLMLRAQVPRLLEPFQQLVFPLINTSKSEMWASAQSHQFAAILEQTWSCWFPVNGNACGDCPMCRGRII